MVVCIKKWNTTLHIYNIINKMIFIKKKSLAEISSHSVPTTIPTDNYIDKVY